MCWNVVPCHLALRSRFFVFGKWLISHQCKKAHTLWETEDFSEQVYGLFTNAAQEQLWLDALPVITNGPFGIQTADLLFISCSFQPLDHGCSHS